MSEWIKKIKNKKVETFWLMMVFIFTIPFVYVETGIITAGMVFIIYASQLFQMWALNDIQDSIKKLFDNDIVVMKAFNKLSDDLCDQLIESE